MATITIEGSLTPSSDLPRGQRRRVQDSKAVRKLVAAGFAVIVDEETGEVEYPEGTGLQAPIEPPPRSGEGSGRENWSEWLATYTDIVTEGKDRAELIAEFDEWVKTHDLPAAPQD